MSNSYAPGTTRPFSNDSSIHCNLNNKLVINIKIYCLYSYVQELDYEQSHYRSTSNSPDHLRGDRLSPIASPMPARLPAIPVKRGFRSATNSLDEPTSRSPTPDQLQSGNKALVCYK